MTLVEPVAVFAITQPPNSMRIPCALLPDGVEDTPRGRARRYRVVVEFDWAQVAVMWFEVIGWPDDVMFVVSVPGLSVEQANAMFDPIPWRERVGLPTP